MPTIYKYKLIFVALKELFGTPEPQSYDELLSLINSLVKNINISASSRMYENDKGDFALLAKDANSLSIRSFLYVCMVNTIYFFSFVETPRKFIIAELSIRKLGSSSVLIISYSLVYSVLLALMKIRAYGSKALL